MDAKKAYFKHKSKSISSIAIYLNDSNISQSEGEELGMWRHIEDAKGGRDCGHYEDPQKQPGKRLLYRKLFLQYMKKKFPSLSISLC